MYGLVYPISSLQGPQRLLLLLHEAVYYQAKGKILFIGVFVFLFF